MNIFEYAMYRGAVRLMTKEELEVAQALAEMADAGNTAAQDELRELVRGIIRAPSKDGL